MIDQKSLATFSWDDGHPLDIRIAQLFNKYGLRCTFYIPKNNSENLPTLSPSDLRELSKDNFDIHSHTLNHIYLNKLQPHEQASEIQSGKKYIEDAIGQADNIFCYPGGRYTKKTIDLVKGAGFEFARTVDMGFDCAYSSNNFLMPTTTIIAPLTNFQILKHSLKRRSLLRGLNILKLNNAVINKTWASQLDARCYHFWGHSWEIDKYNLWESLEILIQNLVASNIKIVSNKEFYQQKSLYYKSNL